MCHMHQLEICLLLPQAFITKQLRLPMLTTELPVINLDLYETFYFT